MTARVVVRDNRKRFDALKAQLSKLADGGVYVGVFGDQADTHVGDGITLVELAAIHEFGLGDAEERSFLRAWIDANRKPIANAMATASRQATANGASPSNALHAVAEWAAGQVKKFIASNSVQPSSSEATNRAKGSTVTLVDSGTLRAAIQGRVVTGRE